jgi:hypothetical protein
MDTKIRGLMTNIYIYSIAFSIFPLFWISIPSISISTIQDFFSLLFWILLCIAAEYRPIMIPKGREIHEITLSFAIHVSTILLLGTYNAVFVAMLATLLVEILSRKSWYKVLFNTGQYGISILVGGSVYYLLKTTPAASSFDILVDMLPFLVGSTVYIILNLFFVSAVIALTSGNAFLDIFIEDFKVIIGYYYAVVPISGAIALLYDPSHPYVILIMTPPLIMADIALRRYYSLQQETQETLKVLANIIDERDEYTYAHSDRVAEYARKIAEHLQLPLSTIDEIEMAGRIHDLGKIGIEDRILLKKSKLTVEEYEKIKKHPEIAHRLLKKLNPSKEGVNYVLYHHERIDGKGYPCGISDKAIPLGARILAVADSYDAMTTDRPYRKALSRSEAIEELQRNADTQFDPTVVGVFIHLLNTDYADQED